MGSRACSGAVKTQFGTMPRGCNGECGTGRLLLTLPLPLPAGGARGLARLAGAAGGVTPAALACMLAAPNALVLLAKLLAGTAAAALPGAVAKPPPPALLAPCARGPEGHSGGWLCPSHSRSPNMPSCGLQWAVATAGMETQERAEGSQHHPALADAPSAQALASCQSRTAGRCIGTAALASQTEAPARPAITPWPPHRMKREVRPWRLVSPYRADAMVASGVLPLQASRPHSSANLAGVGGGAGRAAVDGAAGQAGRVVGGAARRERGLPLQWMEQAVSAGRLACRCRRWS